jgi:hypothetical protein
VVGNGSGESITHPIFAIYHILVGGMPTPFYKNFLVGGIPSTLKNDGVRQWEG